MSRFNAPGQVAAQVASTIAGLRDRETERRFRGELAEQENAIAQERLAIQQEGNDLAAQQLEQQRIQFEGSLADAQAEREARAALQQQGDDAAMARMREGERQQIATEERQQAFALEQMEEDSRIRREELADMAKIEARIAEQVAAGLETDRSRLYGINEELDDIEIGLAEISANRARLIAEQTGQMGRLGSSIDGLLTQSQNAINRQASYVEAFQDPSAVFGAMAAAAGAARPEQAAAELDSLRIPFGFGLGFSGSGIDEALERFGGAGDLSGNIPDSLSAVIRSRKVVAEGEDPTWADVLTAAEPAIASSIAENASARITDAQVKEGTDPAVARRAFEQVITSAAAGSSAAVATAVEEFRKHMAPLEAEAFMSGLFEAAQRQASLIETEGSESNAARANGMRKLFGRVMANVQKNVVEATGAPSGLSVRALENSVVGFLSDVDRRLDEGDTAGVVDMIVAAPPQVQKMLGYVFEDVQAIRDITGQVELLDSEVAQFERAKQKLTRQQSEARTELEDASALAVTRARADVLGARVEEDRE